MRFLAGTAVGLAFLALLGSASFATAQAVQAVPKLEARVTDLTGTLTAGQQAELEQKLAAFEQRKGSQIALLIVPTTAPETIEQFALRVAETWKLGRAKPDDGALLLVAIQDRALRIEVGYGLEGVMPDAISRRIIDDTITPLFRQGDFYGGVNAGLAQMINLVDGETLPPPDQSWRRRGESLFGFLPILFFGVLIGGAVLRAIFGPTLGSMLTGGAVGGIVFTLSKLLLVGAFAGLAAFIFSLMLGLSTTVHRARGRRGDWGGIGGPPGGWGGGGFGGGFGGGGFGGGGGGFGGGGASGRW